MASAYNGCVITISFCNNLCGAVLDNSIMNTEVLDLNSDF